MPVSAILNNNQNRIEATQHIGKDSSLIYGEEYTDGKAVQCAIPHGILFDKEFKKREIEGYYSIRVFWGVIGSMEPMSNALTIEVYEDGELLGFESMDCIDGEIKLAYMDQTESLGSRVTMWFDPKCAYRIRILTDGSITVPIFLDYLQFTQLHHMNPLLSWVNASEVIGGFMVMDDYIMDAVTGDGTPSIQYSVLANYPFKEVLYINATFMDQPTMQVALDSSGYENLYPENTQEVPCLFGRGDGANWSGDVNFVLHIHGTVELPMVRPL